MSNKTLSKAQRSIKSAPFLCWRERQIVRNKEIHPAQFVCITCVVFCDSASSLCPPERSFCRSFCYGENLALTKSRPLLTCLFPLVCNICLHFLYVLNQRQINSGGNRKQCKSQPLQQRLLHIPRANVGRRRGQARRLESRSTFSSWIPEQHPHSDGCQGTISYYLPFKLFFWPLIGQRGIALLHPTSSLTSVSKAGKCFLGKAGAKIEWLIKNKQQKQNEKKQKKNPKNVKFENLKI